MDQLRGLTQAEARRRLATSGPNRLLKTARYSVVRLLVAQFISPLIMILLLAMVVTFVLGDTVDAVVIGLAILLNTSLGFWQEYKAERSLEALSAVMQSYSLVVREGVRERVTTEEVVPGDVVYLAAGERIPADGVVLRASDLRVNEAVLTGEAVAVGKREVSAVADKDKQRSVNEHFVTVEKRQKSKGAMSVYGGTTVVTGEGLMQVVATGMKTEVGRIAGALQATVDEPTPLQVQLSKLSKRIAVAVAVIAVVLFGVGVYSGVPVLTMFTVAVAVAVSAIPEGLVVSLTAILAVGMQRILGRKALVRKLVAAEVLGSVSVICTDKTGTLTEGKMEVQSVLTDEEKLLAAAAVSAAVGTDQLETAWHVWGKKVLGNKTEETKRMYERIDRRPFMVEKKYSVTLTEREGFMVGAPEAVLAMAQMGEKDKETKRQWMETQARLGMRVVAVAHRRYQGETKITEQLMQKRWYFLGMVAYRDVTRPGLKKVLAEVKRAGIRVVMITGDYAETALAVWRGLGEDLPPEAVMNGEELSELRADDLATRIGGIRLFARTSPSQKLLIVNALQEAGEVVAMTGDGVNDAPALKKADIGIVVNEATDVAKETADMVLLNSDFRTIVGAVEEGRGIFKNLRKVLLYLLSDSFTEVLLMIAAFVIGLPIPLTAAQILWVNLANDGLPGMALTVDPHISGLLNRPPRKRGEAIVDGEIGLLVVLISIVTALMVMVGYWGELAAGATLAEARTFAFALLGVDSLVYVFSSRSMRTPLWRDVPWRNPWLLIAVMIGLLMQWSAVYVPQLQMLLGTVPLPLPVWVEVVGMSLGVVAVIELVKFLYWRRHVTA